MNATIADPAFWSRLQFAFTITYHYLFPQLGGLFSLCRWCGRPDASDGRNVRFLSGKCLCGRPTPETKPNPSSAWLGFFVVLASVWALVSGFRQHQELRRFWGSNALITSLLGTGAITLFPVMLYSSGDAQNTMTAYTAAADRSNLLIASIWWPIAFVLVAGYFAFLVRYYFGKVNLERDTQGYHGT